MVQAARGGGAVWAVEAVIAAAVAVIAGIDLLVIRKRVRARRETSRR